MFYLWSRNKHVACQARDGNLCIQTRVEESFFAGSVTITVQPDGLRIVGLQAEMSRPIHPECKNALSLLNQMVGTPIAEGLTKRVDAAIGGIEGCTHMANLVLECCHGAALSFRQLKMAEAFAAGLKPDDFYRVFIQTRPKELLNSCVAFVAGSPLLERLTADAGNAPTRRFVLSSRFTDSSLPIVGFSRNKFIGIGRSAKGNFVARSLLEDNVHGMSIEVEFRSGDLEIVRVSGEMARVPNVECSQALGVLQRAVGLGVRPGLTAAVDELIGRQGCPHLANLLLECCHGVIQGTLGAVVQDSRQSQDGLDWDGITATWLERFPLLQNGCLAYRQGGRLMSSIPVPVA